MRLGLALLWHSPVITGHYCDMAGVITGEWPRTGEFMANLNETLSGLGTHITSASSSNTMYIHHALQQSLPWCLFGECLRRSCSCDHHPVIIILVTAILGPEARWLRLWLRPVSGPAPVTGSSPQSGPRPRPVTRLRCRPGGRQPENW